MDLVYHEGFSREPHRPRAVTLSGHARPVVDILWFHEDYLNLFAAAELALFAHYKPLGRDDEPYKWLTETSIAPWMTYVLGR